MRKSDFLQQLRAEICAAAIGILGPDRVRGDCPELDYWFDHYEGVDAARLERAVLRYVPDASAAASAAEYIPAVVSRISRAVRIWAATGVVTDLPESLSPEQLGAESMTEPPVLLKPSSASGQTDEPEIVLGDLDAGAPLPGPIRNRMETAFDRDFSAVRIHTGTRGATVANRLGARAFAVGDDVGFAAGEFRPGSLSGDALIAHELTHTVQQSRGGPGGSGGMEREADSAAAGLLAFGRAVPVSLRGGLAVQRCKPGTPDQAPEQTPSPTPSPTPTPTPQQQPPQGPPPEPTAACDRTVAPGAVVADHRVDRQTIQNPGEETTFTVTFSCQVRGEGWSDIVDAAGNSLGLRRRIGARGSGHVIRTWDGKKLFTGVGTYMVDDGPYRHKVTDILYAYGAPPSRRAPAPDLRITESFSPPVTIRTRGNVAAAPAAAGVPATSHYTPANATALGAIVNSEMGVGNQQEEEAIAWAVRNQMVRMNTRDVVAVRDAFGDAHDQPTTPAFTALAEGVLRQPLSADPTGGAVKWFSPRRMEQRRPGLDTRGGQITVSDFDGRDRRVFAPSWHLTMHFEDAVTGVRQWNLRLYSLR